VNFLQDAAANQLGSIALGAVQLGLPYGIANSNGKPDAQTCFAILDAAQGAGIRVLDTAQAYGDSEALIGKYCGAHPDRSFHVISKLNPGCDYRDGESVLKAVARSVDLLGAPLASLLIHDPTQLRFWHAGVGDALMSCVASGYTESIGVSTYTPEEFEAALVIPDIRVIQAPFSALDRRLLVSGLLQQAVASGRVVFLRSVLLQGLLLMEPDAIPDRVSEARPLVAAWRRLCEEAELSPLAMALNYARQRAVGAILLTGCEQPDQVRANVALVGSKTLSESQLSAIDALPVPIEKVVNPSLWGK